MKNKAKDDQCLIDPHFEKVEWGWLNNPDGETGGCGELVLFRKIIQQALLDACTISRKTVYHRLRAIDWILDSHKQFPAVCDLADVNAENIRTLTRRAMENSAFCDELRARLVRALS